MKYSILLSMVFYALSLQAQDAQETLDKIQEKFQTIQDLKSGFDQVAIDNSGKMQFKNSGTFYYKKPNKFRIELDKQTIVSDNQTLWNYNKNQNRVLIDYVSDDPSSFSIEKYIMEYPSQCDVSMVNYNKESNNAALLLIPSNLVLEFNSVKLWYDKDFIVNKIEIVDLNDIVITISLSNVAVNQNIPESNFKFTPPEGTQVIDLR